MKVSCRVHIDVCSTPTSLGPPVIEYYLALYVFLTKLDAQLLLSGFAFRPRKNKVYNVFFEVRLWLSLHRDVEMLLCFLYFSMRYTLMSISCTIATYPYFAKRGFSYELFCHLFLFCIFQTKDHASALTRRGKKLLSGLKSKFGN